MSEKLGYWKNMDWTIGPLDLGLFFGQFLGLNFGLFFKGGWVASFVRGWFIIARYWEGWVGEFCQC